jgi:hypothetical protein
MFYATRDILEIALEEMNYKHNTTGKINRLLKMSDVLEGKQLNRTKGGYYDYDYVGVYNIHTTIQICLELELCENVWLVMRPHLCQPETRVDF